MDTAQIARSEHGHCAERVHAASPPNANPNEANRTLCSFGENDFEHCEKTSLGIAQAAVSVHQWSMQGKAISIVLLAMPPVSYIDNASYLKGFSLFLFPSLSPFAEQAQKTGGLGTDTAELTRMLKSAKDFKQRRSEHRHSRTATTTRHDTHETRGLIFTKIAKEISAGWRSGLRHGQKTRRINVSR